MNYMCILAKAITPGQDAAEGKKPSVFDILKK